MTFKVPGRRRSPVRFGDWPAYADGERQQMHAALSTGARLLLSPGEAHLAEGRVLAALRGRRRETRRLMSEPVTQTARMFDELVSCLLVAPDFDWTFVVRVGIVLENVAIPREFVVTRN